MRQADIFKTAVVVLALLSVASGSSAQLEPYNLKFNSGQNIAPVFEGWSRNADGSFAMAFGYLNRNWIEEIHVPIGPDNNFEPGGPDRGQPTYFYTRIRRYAFVVTVPKDWGKKELVWTLSVHGKTERAVGWLQPEWEVESGLVRSLGSGGRAAPDIAAKNLPPAIQIGGVPPVIGLQTPLTLTTTVTDDGLPPPVTFRPRAAPGGTDPATLKGGAPSPVNVPELQKNEFFIGMRPGPPQGLSLSWIVWRGPGGVTFEPAGYVAVKSGTPVAVTATFTTPGDYLLRARAHDGMLSTLAQVAVTVNGAPAPVTTPPNR
jgi:hypothetical protein